MSTNPWLTNARDIVEDVLVPFELVAWHIHRWDGEKPIIYGDNHTLFIFDAANRVLHSFMRDSYITHEILSVEHSEDNHTAILIKMRNPFQPMGPNDLGPEMWTIIMKLVQSCPRARRWFMRIRTDVN